MATVGDLLQKKGNEIWSITPQTSVLQALQMMAEKKVGSLLILENRKMTGIITERDFVREIARTGACLIDAPVNNYMTKDVFSVEPDFTIEECMQLMTRKRIRHLPVIENGKLLGIISIGDVVKEFIAAKDSAINNLENYIDGRGYGH